MTVKEMSEAILNYCRGQENCDHCRMDELVKGGCRNCYSYNAIDAQSEAVIVENYKFLFGDPEVPAPENDSVNHPSHYCQGGFYGMY